MDGEIYANGHESEQYENVTVYLYSDSRSLLMKRNVGTLRPGDPIIINITSDRVPKYVIIHSDDFYTANANVLVSYLERGRYNNRTVWNERDGGRDNYPVTLPDETE